MGGIIPQIERIGMGDSFPPDMPAVGSVWMHFSQVKQTGLPLLVFVRVEGIRQEILWTSPDHYDVKSGGLAIQYLFDVQVPEDVKRRLHDTKEFKRFFVEILSFSLEEKQFKLPCGILEYQHGRYAKFKPFPEYGPMPFWIASETEAFFHNQQKVQGLIEPIDYP